MEITGGCRVLLYTPVRVLVATMVTDLALESMRFSQLFPRPLRAVMRLNKWSLGF